MPKYIPFSLGQELLAQRADNLKTALTTGALTNAKVDAATTQNKQLVVIKALRTALTEFAVGIEADLDDD